MKIAIIDDTDPEKKPIYIPAINQTLERDVCAHLDAKVATLPRWRRKKHYKLAKLAIEEVVEELRNLTRY